jgi:hypothetical protein
VRGNGFDSMPVRVKNEGSEVVGVIEGTQSGRSILPAAGGERGGMKGLHSRSIGRTEAQMHAA